MNNVSNETFDEPALEGEHQSPQLWQGVFTANKQATFLTYRSLSEWVIWAQPLAMTMQRGRMPGVTKEVMVVDYISRNT